MAEIVEGFGTDERQRIAGLRREGQFFWLDASLTDMSAEDLGEALEVSEHAMRPIRLGELLQLTAACRRQNACARAGDRWRQLYECALAEGYRFLSFGDAMLVGRKR